jgi:hypothetical protein
MSAGDRRICARGGPDRGRLASSRRDAGFDRHDFGDGARFVEPHAPGPFVDRRNALGGRASDVRNYWESNCLSELARVLVAESPKKSGIVGLKPA